MIEDLNQVLEQLQAYLNADLSLGFNETVSIIDYSFDFPSGFDKYAIIVSPRSLSFSLRCNKVTNEKNDIDIVCVVKNFDPELSLTGTQPGEVGIIEMVYRVWNSAGQFLETNRSSFDVDYTELASDIDLENKKNERRGFFHEVVIPLKVKLKTNRHPKAG